jgi:hypothetical protein
LAFGGHRQTRKRFAETCNEAEAARNPRLSVYANRLLSNRVGGRAEPGRDLFVLETFSEQFGDLLFSLAQSSQASSG